MARASRFVAAAGVFAAAHALSWSGVVGNPLTYGSVVTLRIGYGNQAASYTYTQQVRTYWDAINTSALEGTRPFRSRPRLSSHILRRCTSTST